MFIKRFKLTTRGWERLVLKGCLHLPENLQVSQGDPKEGASEPEPRISGAHPVPLGGQPFSEENPGVSYSRLGQANFGVSHPFHQNLPPLDPFEALKDPLDHHLGRIRNATTLPRSFSLLPVNQEPVDSP